MGLAAGWNRSTPNLEELVGTGKCVRIRGPRKGCVRKLLAPPGEQVLESVPRDGLGLVTALRGPPLEYQLLLGRRRSDEVTTVEIRRNDAVLEYSRASIVPLGSAVEMEDTGIDRNLAEVIDGADR